MNAGTDHLPRVEGHGRIVVRREGGRVLDVDLQLWESPRLFEALLRGKHYTEVPEIVCRICSICSTVHKVAALQAVEEAVGLQVDGRTRLWRELAVYGGHIESHALHLFLLALPDYLRVDSFPEAAAKEPGTVTDGLQLKKAGNLIQETVGGRIIHPANLLPGRLGREPSREALAELEKALRQALQAARRGVEFFLGAEEPVLPLQYLRFLVVDAVERPLFGRRLRFEGEEAFDVADYRMHLPESPPATGNAKVAETGDPPAAVGAWARLRAGMPLSSEARSIFPAAASRLSDIRGNNLAQAVELLHSVEHGIELINSLASALPSPAATASPESYGTGTSCIEAPRGTLIHHYSFDSHGYCTGADILTPTAINQRAMRRDLLAVAVSLEKEDDGTLRRTLERLVRCYDPCISCAVHLLSI